MPQRPLLDVAYNFETSTEESAKKNLLEQSKQGEWRCFHCDEVLTDYEEAMLHFGERSDSTAACQIDVAEVRKMAKQLARYRFEDTEIDRAMQRMQTEHRVALREAEEKGYRRGLIDQVYNNG